MNVEKSYSFECLHADTCLPDYWGGHRLPHVSIPVHKGMTLADIKSELNAEINQGAIAGGVDYETVENPVFLTALRDAVNAIEPSANKTDDSFFNDLEDTDEDCDYSVYAYFVFTEKDD